jgi:hypothetical protein
MVSVPYDIVALEASRLTTLAAVSSNWETASYWMDRYYAFLSSCGWAPLEFDQEMLRRIDIVWERIYQEAFYSSIIRN